MRGRIFLLLLVVLCVDARSTSLTQPKLSEKTRRNVDDSRPLSKALYPKSFSSKSKSVASLIQSSKALIAVKEQAKFVICATVLTIMGIVALVMDLANSGIKTWRAMERLALSTEKANAAGLNQDMKDHVQAERNFLYKIISKAWNQLKVLLTEEERSQSKKGKEKFSRFMTKAEMGATEQGATEVAVDETGSYAIKAAIWGGDKALGLFTNKTPRNLINAALNAASPGLSQMVPLVGCLFSAGSLGKTLYYDDHRIFCDPVPGKADIKKDIAESTVDGVTMPAYKEGDRVDKEVVENDSRLKEKKHWENAANCDDADIQIDKITTDTTEVGNAFCEEMYRSYLGYKYFANSLTGDTIEEKFRRKDILVALGVMIHHTRAAYCNLQHCISDRTSSGLGAKFIAEGRVSGATEPQKVIAENFADYELHCDPRAVPGPRPASSKPVATSRYVAALEGVTDPPQADDPSTKLFSKLFLSDPDSRQNLQLVTKIAVVSINGPKKYHDVEVAVHFENPAGVMHFLPKDTPMDTLMTRDEIERARDRWVHQTVENTEGLNGHSFTQWDQAQVPVWPSNEFDQVLGAIRSPSLPTERTTYPTPICPKYLRRRNQRAPVFMRWSTLTVRRYRRRFFDSTLCKVDVLFAVQPNLQVEAFCFPAPGQKSMADSKARCESDADRGRLLLRCDSGSGYDIDLDFAMFLAPYDFADPALSDDDEYRSSSSPGDYHPGTDVDLFPRDKKMAPWEGDEVRSTDDIQDKVIKNKDASGDKLKARTTDDIMEAESGSNPPNHPTKETVETWQEGRLQEKSERALHAMHEASRREEQEEMRARRMSAFIPDEARAAEAKSKKESEKEEMRARRMSAFIPDEARAAEAKSKKESEKEELRRAWLAGTRRVIPLSGD